MSGVCGIVWLCLSIYVFSCLLVILWLCHTCLDTFASAACPACKVGGLHLPCNRQTKHMSQGPMNIAGTWPNYNGGVIVLQDAIIGLCSGPAALFTMGALLEATIDFLTNLPQDSRAPPVEGLTWVRLCASVNPFCTSNC